MLSDERSVYAPSRSSRIVGVLATSGVFATAIAAFFLTFQRFVPQKTPSALTVVSIEQPASPPEASPEVKEAPKPIEKRAVQPQVPELRPPDRYIDPVKPVSVTLPSVTLKQAVPRPNEPDTAAPLTVAAPPAPRVQSNAPDSWEGRVLAALNACRRYPPAAMSRRQQGVPYIRFVIDREGRVVSSRLEKSSGYAELDREAVALPKRASPLPSPPNERPGDTIELVVPVEYFIR